MEIFLNYWEVILAVVSLIASVVVMVISKKNNFQHVISYVATELPKIIAIVEEASKNGAISKEQKKESAISLVVSDTTARFGKLSEKNIGVITKFASRQIEAILDTPQKKGA